MQPADVAAALQRRLQPGHLLLDRDMFTIFLHPVNAVQGEQHMTYIDRPLSVTYRS